jgi:glycosyltransferase involved in cell wall biosynthesis
VRVCHVVPSFYPAHVYGGPIETLYHLCLHSARKGCEVRVLTTDANGADSVLDVEKRREVEIAERFYVRYCARLFPHSVSPKLISELLRYVRWADVVHLTGVYSFPTIPTLFACRLLDKPVAWSPHGSLQRWPGTTRSHLKALWEWVCRFIRPSRLVLYVSSEEEARESSARFPGVTTAVIPSGVEVPENLSHVSDNGTFRLLYLGRLHPIKGIELLLEACSILGPCVAGGGHRLESDNHRGESVQSWSLTLAGGGDPAYARNLTDTIERLGLSKSVRMLGDVRGEQKERLFADADVLVLPSYKENFGMVVVEALAHRLPVIASTGTPWKRLQEIGCGLWVDNDPKSLATAIQQMRQMPLTEMGSRAQLWMREEFSWQSRAKTTIELYRSLLECQSRRHARETHPYDPSRDCVN